MAAPSVFVPILSGVPSCPHSASQPVGLFAPQALLDDLRLKPVERNAWIKFRSLADGNGIVTASHESLRTALLCAPGSSKAVLTTVSRVIFVSAPDRLDRAERLSP